MSPFFFFCVPCIFTLWYSQYISVEAHLCFALHMSDDAAAFIDRKEVSYCIRYSVFFFFRLLKTSFAMVELSLAYNQPFFNVTIELNPFFSLLLSSLGVPEVSFLCLLWTFLFNKSFSFAFYEALLIWKINSILVFCKWIE